MKSRAAVIFGFRAPGPPGTMRTSISGAVLKVCVGVIGAQTDDCNVFITLGSGDTGSSVSDSRTTSVLCIRPMKFKTSSGPVTSVVSKAGNRTMPYRLGMVPFKAVHVKSIQ